MTVLVSLGTLLPSTLPKQKHKQFVPIAVAETMKKANNNNNSQSATSQNLGISKHGVQCFHKKI